MSEENSTPINFETTLSPIALATVKGYFTVEGMKAEAREEKTPDDVLHNLDLVEMNTKAEYTQRIIRNRIIALTASSEVNPDSISDDEFNHLLQAIVNDPANGLKADENETTEDAQTVTVS